MPKRVGNALYVHRSAVHTLPPDRQAALRRAQKALPKGTRWSVVRSKPSEVMFARTTDFFSDPHPQLRATIRVSTKPRVEVIDRRDYNPLNAPIYHRKECFLAPDHPKRTLFASLTAAEEAAGLLNRPDIGWSAPWGCLLANEDWMIEGHRLVKADTLGCGQSVKGSKGFDLFAAIAEERS